VSVCHRCRLREAVASRRTISAIGTWSAPVPVCDDCCDELDDVAEQCNRWAISVDRAIRDDGDERRGQ